MKLCYMLYVKLDYSKSDKFISDLPCDMRHVTCTMRK